MEPTLFVGDKLVFDKYYYRDHPVNRGDLVILSRPDSIAIKRITALGGDTIEGKQREVFLNGQTQSEPFIQHKFRNGAYEWFDTFGPVDIPAGKYFVMGDNRDVSLDSRSADFGLVDRQSIVGRPLYGYQITGKPLSWKLN